MVRCPRCNVRLGPEAVSANRCSTCGTVLLSDDVTPADAGSIDGTLPFDDFEPDAADTDVDRTAISGQSRPDVAGEAFDVSDSLPSTAEFNIPVNPAGNESTGDETVPGESTDDESVRGESTGDESTEELPSALSHVVDDPFMADAAADGQPDEDHNKPGAQGAQDDSGNEADHATIEDDSAFLLFDEFDVELDPDADTAITIDADVNYGQDAGAGTAAELSSDDVSATIHDDGESAEIAAEAEGDAAPADDDVAHDTFVDADEPFQAAGDTAAASTAGNAAAAAGSEDVDVDETTLATWMSDDDASPSVTQADDDSESAFATQVLDDDDDDDNNASNEVAKSDATLISDEFDPIEESFASAIEPAAGEDSSETLLSDEIDVSEDEFDVSDGDESGETYLSDEVDAEDDTFATSLNDDDVDDNDDAGRSDSAATFISDEVYVESEESFAPAAPSDAGSSETYLSNEEDNDQTVVSGEFSSVDLSSGSGSGDNEAIMKTIAAEWGDAAKNARPNTSLKSKESGSLNTRQTLVIKSKVLSETRHVHGTASDVEYELLKVLGEGGMGIVYMARQTSIDRAVAVKMLKPETASKERHRQKFLAEAVVTGELDHPNIVPIYDVGSNPDGALFYSMKRVQGTPWVDVIGDKSLAENLDILMRVADAVAFAHARGVIHRDLKPENTMLGEFGEVLVMDWGLAQPMMSFRKHGSVANIRTMGGTPAYMAPEMALGPIESIGEHSDVYLLGAILYEIVTGKPPHRAKSAQLCLIAAAQNRIAETDKTGELVDIALKAMASRPQDRYAGVKAFQAAIRDYQSHTESVVLAAHAAEELEVAKSTQNYQSFAKSLYGFQEAVALWDGNETAQRGLDNAKWSYADCALQKGDYDLGESLLNRDDPNHAELLEQLVAGRRERDARQSRLRMLRRLAGGLAAAIFLIVGVSFFLVNRQRNIAIANAAEATRQAEIAASNEREAARNEREAKRQTAIAKVNADEAQRQTVIATENADEARKQERLALSNLEEAKRQEELARTNAAEAVKQSELARENEYFALIGLAAAKIDENSFDSARQLLTACRPAAGQRELRGWEWGRLMHVCSQSSRTFAMPHKVDAIALSPDDTRFVAVGEQGLAEIRNVANGQVLFQLPHEEQPIAACAWSSDGRWIATGGGNDDSGFVRLWDAATGTLVRELNRQESTANDPGHRNAVLHVAFSPDSSRLISAGQDDTARIWNLSDARQTAVLHGHFGPVWSAEFSPDMHSVVTAGDDGTAIVWSDVSRAWDDRETIRQGTPFRGHRGPVFTATFTPDGRHVATGGHDRRILIWRPDAIAKDDLAAMIAGATTEQTPAFALEGHTASVRSLKFSMPAAGSDNDERLSREFFALSCGHDNTVRMWRIATEGDSLSGEGIAAFRGHSSWVRSCTFSRNAEWILSGSHDATVAQWSRADYTPIRELRNRSLQGHYDAVLAAAFSSDGTQIVTASQDRTARTWSFDTGDVQTRLEEGHEFLLSAVEFFPPGSHDWLVTSAGDNSVRIWNIDTGSQLRQLSHTGRRSAIAISHDGQRILTGSDVNSAQLWDTRTGIVIREFKPHNREVTAVAFSQDDRLIFTGESRGTGHLWDVATGRELHRLDGHNRRVVDAAFLPDNRTLLTASSDNTVARWDMATGREQRSSNLRHPDAVMSMDVSPDGRTVVTSCADRQVRLWNLNNVAQPVATFKVSGRSAAVAGNMERLMTARGHTADTLARQAGLNAGRLSAILGRDSVATESELIRLQRSLNVDRADLQRPLVNAVRFSPDGSQLLAVNVEDRLLQVLDVASGESKITMDRLGAVWSAAFSPDGRHVVSVGGQEARLWSTQTGIDSMIFSPHGTVASAAFSPNRRLIVTAGFDNSARIWDAETGRSVLRLTGHQMAVNRAAFSADGKTILTASSDGTARIWNADDGSERTAYRGHTGAVLDAGFSPDGESVVTASADGTARLWAIDATATVVEQPLREFRPEGGAAVLCASFSADGRRLATGGEDSSAHIWDVGTGNIIMSCQGHTASVTSVAFAPNTDGNRLLTGSEDYTVKLWDTGNQMEAGSAREILNLTGHSREVTSVAFSRDGRNALSASRDGRAILWLTSPWKETP